MRNKGQLILGAAVVTFGLILLLFNLLNISIWRFVWPILLIAVGVLVILRQQRDKGDIITQFGFVRDIKCRNSWNVNNSEYWHFVADVDIDFSQATFDEGKYHWQLYGFVHEIRLRIPDDVGVMLTTNAILTEKKINGTSESSILVPMNWRSKNFETSIKKFQLTAIGFVIDVRIADTQNAPNS